MNNGKKIKCEICNMKTCRSGAQKRIFMAKFPLDSDRCKQWVKVTGKEELVRIPIEKLHIIKYVCGNHFKPRDFKKKKTQLRKSAIPSLGITAKPLKDEVLIGFPFHIEKSNSIIETTPIATVRIDHDHNYTACNQDRIVPTVPVIVPKESPRQCVSCKEWSDDGKRVINMTTFPSNPYSCKKWVQVLGIEELGLKTMEEVSKDTYLCYQHFSEEQLVRNGSEVKVKEDAVPHININRPPLDDGLFDGLSAMYDCDDNNTDGFQANQDDAPDDEPSLQLQPGNINTDLPSVADDIQKNRSKLYDESVLARLVHVMEETVFCSLCLSTDESCLSPLDATNHYALWRNEAELSYLQILKHVFGSEIKDQLPSYYICQQCSKSAIEALTFIHQSKTTHQVLNSYISDIELTINGVQHTSQDFKYMGLPVTEVTILPQIHRDINIAKELKITKNKLVSSKQERLYPEAYRIADNKYYLCECGVRKDNMKNFVLHARLHNEVYDNLKCASCQEAHMAGSICKYTCKVCETTHDCGHDKYIVEFVKQKENGAESVKCPDCDFTTTKKFILVEHANKMHLDNYSLLCDKCSQTFYSKKSLQDHIYKFHTEKYCCEYCSRKFTLKPSKDSHEQQCKKTRRQFGCTMCKYSSNTQKELNHHCKKKHGQILDCSVCNFKAINEKQLRMHMTMTHSGKTLQKLCLSCGIMVEKGKMKEHMDSEHSKIPKPKTERYLICKHCQGVFSSRTERDEHMKTHVSYYTCQRCQDQVVATKRREHMRCHEIEDAGEAFPCDKCDKQFPTRHRLKLHEPIHYEPIQCNICNKSIKYLCFKVHMLRHKVEKDPMSRAMLKNRSRLKCPKCEHTSYTVGHLEAHINTIHYNRKPHSCDICQRKFAAKYLLSNHLEQHLGTRFQCFECRRKFASRSSYEQHSRKHHGGISYECPTCGERFAQAKALTFHRNYAHNLEITENQDAADENNEDEIVTYENTEDSSQNVINEDLNEYNIKDYDDKVTKAVASISQFDEYIFP